jgi:hypothetical protein
VPTIDTAAAAAAAAVAAAVTAATAVTCTTYVKLLMPILIGGLVLLQYSRRSYCIQWRMCSQDLKINSFVMVCVQVKTEQPACKAKDPV